MSVIESELKFIKIAIKMLYAYLMVRANDRSLEQRPDVLKCVRVNVTTHILFAAMVNRCVDCVLVCYAAIALMLISEYQRGLFLNLCFDESRKDFSGRDFAANAKPKS